MSVRTVSQTPNDEIACPHCRKTIRFHRYGSMGNLNPHFYCDTCSNLFWRAEDFHRVYGNVPTKALIQEITGNLPQCPCGGRFTAGANPKCPHCHQELPHQDLLEDRLFDALAIQVEGAVLIIEE